MRTYPNTLLERSRTAAVRAQQTYAARKGVPWGISESAYFKLDEAGNYQYYAFGLPHLGLRARETNVLVISPYSTFLALNTDPVGAVRNLHKMADMGWFGSHGFYEAADFTSTRHKFWRRRPQLVQCWMAHHQGMSLLTTLCRSGFTPSGECRQLNCYYTRSRSRMFDEETCRVDSLRHDSRFEGDRTDLERSYQGIALGGHRQEPFGIENV
jgi:hypothetical protein